MAYLAVVAGLPARVLFLTTEPVVAGRSPESGLELAHVEVSRQHCRFQWDGESCIVEDLGSVSGTAVNGARIAVTTRLSTGDRVQLGPVTIEFGVGDPPEASTATPGRMTIMLVRGVETERVEIAGDIVIGRDPQVDVVLADPAVSRRHAKARLLPGGGCEVVDLHSTSGSFVNGHRFDQHELTVGDRLQIGPFFFQFDGQALTRIANAAGGSLRAVGIRQTVGEQTILQDMTIAFPPSRFIGIIGPSGAGKSSLLHAISGLWEPACGAVYVDGENVYSESRVRSLGFVPQEDIVHPELTIAEALRFSARLRLPRATPALELQKLLIQTMDQLGLSARADLPIARLSGGQRKRVSVGVELLSKPAILFLDEPTSGLDPATEFHLMELLRDLADTGCTIICTTHVMENAFLMDQLVILVGGCLAFQGSPQAARDYFGVTKLNALYEQLMERPAQDWQRAFLEKGASAKSAPEFEASRKAPPAEERRAFALPILLARQWAILRSDWRNFVILLGQPLVIGALVLWVADDRALVMFFAYLATLWFGCSNAAQEIVKESAIYRREQLIGVGAHAYLASKFIFLGSITIAQALLLYGTLLLGEFGRSGSVGWQLAALLGTALAAVGIGSAISALSRTVTQAVMVVPLILIPQIIFSGFTVPAHRMTNSVRLASHFAPTYSAQVMMDTSFLWQQKMVGQTMVDFRDAYENLVPDNSLDSRDIYARKRPALWALLADGIWIAAMYLLAWIGLRKRERA